MSGKGYGGRNSHHRRYGGHRNVDKSKSIVVGDKSREVMESINENSPVIQMFKQYSAELDAKHDRYERIVKTSRDITIESKRIIFLLHNVDRDSKKDSILKEAEQRLSTLVNAFFKVIAFELEKQDPYQFSRAYSAGLQEYIEALTFFQYLSNKTIEDFAAIQKTLKYMVTDLDKKLKSSEDSPPNDSPRNEREICTLLPPSEYILGLADLTGELMRKCINNLSSGNVEGCFQTCDFVRNIYKGFLGISNAHNSKEIGRKCYILKQSLTKMELVCYNIVVRGSEIPQHMLATVVTQTSDPDSTEDEGYY
ncbi:translin-associated protein X [Chrysoperla carnea]|uniref:translin-associated protein X n=1 Tax=Chrysoperla carnea TaxID=189513 RepID=UPI001D067142|nr:translin-associated protein X [Chrysoperla carnea]